MALSPRRRSVWSFDLDGTLYSNSQTPLHEQMVPRMEKYVAKAMNITLQEARAKNYGFYQRFGLTARGLAIECDDFDVTDFCDFVYNSLDLTGLRPNPELHTDFAKLQEEGCELWILTNSSRSHAKACLAALGVLMYFPDDHILDCVDQWKYSSESLESKPLPGAYDLLLARSGAVEGRDTIVMLEDSEANLHEPARRGWACIYVTDKPPGELAATQSKYPRYQCIANIGQLGTAITAVTNSMSP